MKALRKWCGRNALRHIAVALGLTLMDVLLFLALWKLYLHLFNDLVPSTVKKQRCAAVCKAGPVAVKFYAS